MFESAVKLVFTVFAGYLAAGLIFGLAFVARGIDRTDSSANGAGWTFRFLLLPGLSIFWPVFVLRWYTGAQPPTERTAHR